MAASFTWRETNSADMGVIVEAFPPRTRAKARVTSVTIPGRAGALTISEGEDAYDDMNLTVDCVLLPSADVDAVAAWLTGSGALIFSNDAAHAMRARVSSAISMAKILAVRSHRRFSVTFTVHPFLYQAVPASDLNITASGTAIRNIGTVRSWPLLRIYGTGDFSIMIGGQMVTLALGSITGVLLDCDAQMATNFAGDINRSALVTGDYPYIPTGTSYLTWTGAVTRVVVTPRWRWL